MALEDKLDREIRDSAEFRGEMRQFRTNMEGYIRSVSDNQKQTAKELQAHIADKDAHGADVRAETDNVQGKHIDRWIAVGSLIVAGAAFLLHFHP